MKRFGLVVAGLCLLGQSEQVFAQRSGPKAVGNCRRVVFEGDVKAGQNFEQAFAGGYKFMLEALPSGWIVRVLSSSAPRGAHDYAELATPPYRSVSPLLISTDWAFRAQDAIAWNPREFRYAAVPGAFQKLEGLYSAVMANDAQAMGKAAGIVALQPEASLQILDARLVPGLADQARMASMVAGNLSRTLHEVDSAEKPTPLGRIEELRFRVSIMLAPGLSPATGLPAEKIPCPIPTT